MTAVCFHNCLLAVSDSDKIDSSNDRMLIAYKITHIPAFLTETRGYDFMWITCPAIEIDSAALLLVRFQLIQQRLFSGREPDHSSAHSLQFLFCPGPPQRPCVIYFQAPGETQIRKLRPSESPRLPAAFFSFRLAVRNFFLRNNALRAKM